MRTLLIIVAVLAVFCVLFGVIYYTYPQKPIACTLEAKVCPDGSTVGRTGPDCEFEECPTIQEPEDDSCIALGCSADAKYVGSIKSDKYYECRCGWAKNINQENIVCFASDAEALAENRVKSDC